MEKPLVSVIITTYNRGDKLERAIQSVLNQTYDNLEIIVVDDNKNIEKQRFITKKILKKYKHIKLIENEKNLGGALSRNEGIKKAKGELISFLDDDDIYLENRITDMVNIYIEHKKEKVGLIYCNCLTINDELEITGKYENNYDNNHLYYQMLGCLAGTSMWLVPKKVLININMFEETPCKQDSIVLLKILANDYKIYSTKTCLVKYYEHNGDGISGTKEKNIEGLNNYRTWCRKYYYKLNNPKEINDIEYNFNKQFITLYVINNKLNKAKEEFKNMIKLKLFNINTIKAFLKIYFKSLYLKKIGVKK